MARSWGKHLYWNTMCTISGQDWDGADYLVVDDVPWEYFIGRKAFLGGQRDFILTEKYVRKTKIQWGKPVVYLCNEDPRHEMKDWEEKYFNDNCQFEFVYDKLYEETEIEMPRIMELSFEDGETETEEEDNVVVEI